MPYLAEAFDEIHIISNEKNTLIKRETPPNVKSYSVPYTLSLLDKILSWLQLFNVEFWREISFVRTQYKQPITSQIINTILQSLHKASKFDKVVNRLIPGVLNRKDITLYSYWADNSAVAIAYLRKKYPHLKAVTRAHRWDVYFDKNEALYLPLRKLLVENLNRFYFISDHAKNYFTLLTGLRKNTLQVARLGVLSFISPLQKTNPNKFHLVSCSYVFARKRVICIAEALGKINSDTNIVWTHIGDGDHTLEEVKTLSRSITEQKKNISINFTGRLTQQEIKTFYKKNYIDLFVNVSESEGVPVSIMEAFSASVPALATDADGTREIVLHNQNGLLIDCNFAIAELVSYLEQYINLNDESKSSYRLNARKMYLEKYNEANNYKAFVSSLLSI